MLIYYLNKIHNKKYWIFFLSFIAFAIRVFINTYIFITDLHGNIENVFVYYQKRNRTRNGPFKCSNCERSYKIRNNLTRHIKYECGKIPNFSCPYCPHRTAYKDKLLRHINCKHMKEGDPAKM